MARVRKLAAKGRNTSRKTKYPKRPQTLPGTFIPDKQDDKSPSRTEQVVKTHSLCPKCCPIREWLKNGDFGDLNSGNGNNVKLFNHHSSGLELEKWYLKGCHLCTLIFHSIIDSLAWNLEHGRSQRWSDRVCQLRKGTKLEMTLRGYAKVKKPVLCLNAEIMIQQRSIKPRTLSIICTPRRDDIGTSLETTKHIWNTGLGIIAGTNFSLSTSAAGILELASGWIQECVTKHQNCNAQLRSSKLPSRLLEITNGDWSLRVRVVCTDQLPKRTKYATLSYCWGSTPGYKLESSTSKVLAEGIATELLPRTLQDAVEITHKLGLKWLWVDSLCIMQDSVDDWGKESGEMLETYGNCYICIAATGAEQSKDGIYSERDPLVYQPCRMSKAEPDSSYHVLPHDYLNHLHPCFGNYALQGRGWAVQERLLPPRTLNYGTSLQWECREISRAEMGVVMEESFWRSSWKKDFWSLILSPRPLHQPMTAEMQLEILHLWENIREKYTRATLTYSSDRLTAIKGVIEAFKTRTGWRNHAGLWEPFLLRELLWQKTIDRGTTWALKWPTWSWISVNAGVDSYFSPPEIELAAIERVHEIRTGGALEGVFMAIDIRCLKIAVSLKDGRLGAPLKQGDGLWKEYLLCKPDQVIGRTVWVRPQFWLPLMSWNETLLGIGIQASETVSGAFERVGFYTLSHGTEYCLDIFSDRDKYETVTLV